jgi:hypothetical protein
MKYTIIAILLLACITAYFSIYGEIVPLESQKEGWAFFGGSSGAPIPSEGADGQMDAFVSNAEVPQDTQAKTEQNTVKAQPKPPITITVVYPDMEHAEEYRQAVRETFLIGVAVGALLAELATASVIAILYLREKTHGHQTGKA